MQSRSDVKDTLYDISDIPLFAYEPSWEIWAFVGALLAILFSLWYGLPHLRERAARHRPKPDIVQLALQDLARLKVLSLTPKENLSRVSLTLRRFLSSVTTRDITPFTARELRSLKEELTSTDQKEVISFLLSIEELRFSCSGGEIRDPISQARLLIENFGEEAPSR